MMMIMKKMMTKDSGLLVILLAGLHLALQASALNTTVPPDPLKYSTVPLNQTVAKGKAAIFRCGVPPTAPRLIFTIYTSQGNYTLTCPGHTVMKDLPVKALTGSCFNTVSEQTAVWSFSGTSYSDNNTRVECNQLGGLALEAYLTVLDDKTRFAVIIGCSIGGFFGILLVLFLSFVFVKKSETLQKCFRGKESIDDLTLVSKD